MPSVGFEMRLWLAGKNAALVDGANRRNVLPAGTRAVLACRKPTPSGHHVPFSGRMNRRPPYRLRLTLFARPKEAWAHHVLRADRRPLMFFWI